MTHTALCNSNDVDDLAGLVTELNEVPLDDIVEVSIVPRSDAVPEHSATILPFKRSEK